jgi:predicted dehydrogenase
MTTGLAIVGCGNIAGPYVDDLLNHELVRLIGATDINVSRAEALCAKFDGRAYTDLDAMLADDAVQVVVNLSIHHAHYDLTRRCLEAGRHVYSEKPLAMRYAEAAELVSIAKRQGVRLGCSPFVALGESQQAALREVRSGRLGPVRVAYGEANWGRIESWHPRPRPFYEVGPFFDVGVYPLTLITAALGPAERVTAVGRVVYADRKTESGNTFTPASPDFVVSMLEFPSGAMARVTANFYVPQKASQAPGVEFHGDLGSVRVENWGSFASPVLHAAFGEQFEPMQVQPAGEAGFRWSRGVIDMIHAINEERPHRATGEQAAHLVEILEASYQSIERGKPIDLTSSFEPPELI